jgi:hypothetical protein
MIKEGYYGAYIPLLAAFSPRGAVGPWREHLITDFKNIVQSHFPAGVDWYWLEEILAKSRFYQLENLEELSRAMQYNGIDSSMVRLNVQAFENLRQIFCECNSFIYTPIPGNKNLLPKSERLTKNGRLMKREMIQPFYDCCYCIKCQGTRAEMERQLEEGEDDYDHDGDD